MKTLYAVMSVVAGCAVTPLAHAQDQFWARQFGTPADDWIWDTAPDGAGGVFVGGFTAGQLGEAHIGGDDIFLARFNAAGDQISLAQFGTDQNETINRLGADGAGGVFMAGWTNGSLGGPNQGDRDGWVGRHGADGVALWHVQIGTSAEDWAWDVAPDGTGGVYVTGFTYGLLGREQFGDRDGFVARYDGDGTEIWIRQFGTDADDCPFGAAPDGAGGVFVGGHTYGDLGGPQQRLGDAFIAHYDADGNQSDIVQFGTSEFEQVKNLAADGEGGVFACGSTRGDLNGANEGETDSYVARFDSILDLVWVEQVGSPAPEQWQSCVPDGHGGVHTAGGTSGDLVKPNAGAPDVVIARFDDAGVVWIDQLGTPGFDSALTVASDAAGGVFFAGTATGELFDQHQGGFDAWIARYGCLGDIDGDGVVGITDFLMLLAAWGPCEGACPADLDGSGDVGITDFLMLLAAWGSCL